MHALNLILNVFYNLARTYHPNFVFHHFPNETRQYSLTTTQNFSFLYLYLCYSLCKAYYLFLFHASNYYLFFLKPKSYAKSSMKSFPIPVFWISLFFNFLFFVSPFYFMSCIIVIYEHILPLLLVILRGAFKSDSPFYGQQLNLVL